MSARYVVEQDSSTSTTIQFPDVTTVTAATTGVTHTYTVRADCNPNARNNFEEWEPKFCIPRWNKPVQWWEHFALETCCGCDELEWCLNENTENQPHWKCESCWGNGDFDSYVNYPLISFIAWKRKNAKPLPKGKFFIADYFQQNRVNRHLKKNEGCSFGHLLNCPSLQKIKSPQRFLYEMLSTINSSLEPVDEYERGEIVTRHEYEVEAGDIIYIYKPETESASYRKEGFFFYVDEDGFRLMDCKDIPMKSGSKRVSKIAVAISWEDKHLI